jgi:pimeloyl-ACP methyl ester carboxylesterase
MSTHHTRQGAGSPVVLIHGIGRSLEDWDAVAPALARDHEVYALDLAGYGRSPRLPERTTLLALARAVIAFLDEVGETRPVRLVGNSLGGAVSMQVAVLAPERVAAVVLVDPAGFGADVTVALRAMALPVLGRWLTRSSVKNAVRTVHGIVYDRSYWTEAQVTHTLALSRRKGAKAVMRETATDLGTWGGIRPEWRQRLLPAFAALEKPTLVVWGEKDYILPATHLEAAKTALPHARTHLFPKAGHMPQIERADEFTELVGSFLTEVAA